MLILIEFLFIIMTSEYKEVMINKCKQEIIFSLGKTHFLKKILPNFYKNDVFSKEHNFIKHLKTIISIMFSNQLMKNTIKEYQDKKKTFLDNRTIIRKKLSEIRILLTCYNQLNDYAFMLEIHLFIGICDQIDTIILFYCEKNFDQTLSIMNIKTSKKLIKIINRIENIFSKNILAWNSSNHHVLLIFNETIGFLNTIITSTTNKINSFYFII
ncbi:hypothetical protein NUSPORA_01377 [Nucleospora cyclopteri]